MEPYFESDLKRLLVHLYFTLLGYFHIEKTKETKGSENGEMPLRFLRCLYVKKYHMGLLLKPMELHLPRTQRETAEDLLKN